MDPPTVASATYGVAGEIRMIRQLPERINDEARMTNPYELGGSACPQDDVLVIAEGADVKSGGRAALGT